jgi:hypothetical protein
MDALKNAAAPKVVRRRARVTSNSMAEVGRDPGDCGGTGGKLWLVREMAKAEYIWRVCERLVWDIPATWNETGGAVGLTHPLTRDLRAGTVEESDEEIQTMTGIQFLTDDKGKRTAAVIDLKKHKELWEDIEDVLVSQSRRHEKRIPFEKVKADLIRSGKLRG